jgi:hypothetical protein
MAKTASCIKLGLAVSSRNQTTSKKKTAKVHKHSTDPPQADQL